MIVTIDNLDILKEQKITICSGWFDLFHIGHLNFLNNAKLLGNKLCVLVRNDNDGKIYKGNNRPFIKQSDRIQIIDALKCVDYVIPSEEIKTNIIPNILNLQGKDLNIWERYIPIIKTIKPCIVYSLEETIKFNGIGNYIQNQLNSKVVYANRTKKISTTDIEKYIKTTN